MPPYWALEVVKRTSDSVSPMRCTSSRPRRSIVLLSLPIVLRDYGLVVCISSSIHSTNAASRYRRPLHEVEDFTKGFIGDSPHKSTLITGCGVVL